MWQQKVGVKTEVKEQKERERENRGERGWAVERTLEVWWENGISLQGKMDRRRVEGREVKW